MIKLNDIEITEEQFKELAEREGYVKEFEYPIYMESLLDIGLVVKFTRLRTGTVVVPTDESVNVGVESSFYREHTNPSYWKPWQPHEELKKQYAEDSKTTDEPWLLWEVQGDDWYQCIDKPGWKVERQYRRKETKPKTYSGYTIEQLNQAMDEGLLFEFSKYDAFSDSEYGSKLLGFDAKDTLSFENFERKWLYCRIHRSQPQFVIDGKKPDWLDDDTIIFAKYKNKDTRYMDKARRFNFDGLDRFQVVMI